MRRRLLVLVVLSLPVLLATSPADAEVSLEYLGPLTSASMDDVVPIGDFILGHPGNPVHLLTDPEIYQYYTRCSILSPFACGCDCSSGYTVTRYNLIFAKVGEGEVDGYVTMSLGDSYELDLFPPGTVCFDPPGLVGRYRWPFYCMTGASFTVEQAGYYRLEITPVADCDCIFLDYTQALHLPLGLSDGWGTSLFLVTDDDPDHCPDYTAGPSMGYLWYREIDAPGHLLMWADATCCDTPVDVDRASWDRVKALYR